MALILTNFTNRHSPRLHRFTACCLFSEWYLSY